MDRDMGQCGIRGAPPVPEASQSDAGTGVMRGRTGLPASRGAQPVTDMPDARTASLSFLQPGRAGAPGIGPAATATPGVPASGLAQLAAAVLLLGAAWPITKHAVSAGASPIWFAEGRASLSAVTAALLLLALRRLRLPGRADLPAVAIIGVFQLALFFALSHAAVEFVPAGRTSILSNTTTIWIVPLSLLWLRERTPPRRWAAAAMGLLGVAVMAGPWATDWSRPGVLAGTALLLGAALSWSVAIIAIRRLRPARPMLELVPWSFALAALLLLPLAAFYPVGHWESGAWAAMAAIGLVAAPFGTWCVMQAQANLPVMVTSVGFLATPAVGLLLATLWLGESLGPDLLAGSALIMGGVLVSAWPGRRAAGAARAEEAA